MSSDTTEHQHVEKYPVTYSSPAPVMAAPIIANPGPLGLCGFALTTFVLSLHNAGAGVASEGPHGVVTGLAIFYGGLVQLLAGMWEFKTGNTFAATAFSSYGGFWLSFACIYIPATDVAGSYKGDTALMNRSIGYYLLGWAIFTGIMVIACHRSNIGLISLFFSAFITFVLLTASKIQGSITLQIAGGVVGLITSFIAWYVALAGLLTKDSSHFTLPLGHIN